MNALKTGLHAETELLRFESAEDHAALIAEYYERFHPITPEERCLVDRMISNEWLLRRYRTVEYNVWEEQLRGMSNPGLGVAYTRSSEQLARVDRRLNSAERNFDKAHKELRAIRAKRCSAPQPTETPAENDAETTQVNPELGSFLISINDSPNQPPINEINPRKPTDAPAEESNMPLAA